MLLDNYKKQSPIVGVAGLGGGINSYIFLSSGEDYIISKSLRFNSADTSYLSKTFSSDGNRRTNTISFWIKKVKNDASAAFYRIFGSQQASHIYLYEDKIFWDISTTDNASAAGYRWTNRLFRDPSAWYHIVCTLDTTQSTASNRMRLYVNGVEETSFQATTNMGQNDQTGFSQGGIEHTFGYRSSNQGSAGGALDAFLADLNFIDGQALSPTDFGEFDTSGVWQPKKYSGSYGTNGFHLDFKDSSSNAALGYDAAGSNNFTVNNLKASAPGLATANQGMDVVTYTGNAGTKVVSGLAFQPDLLWLKRSDGASHHYLVDSVRGLGTSERLASDTTDAGGDGTQRVASFNSDGFTVSGNYGYTNISGGNYVAWAWKAGGTASSNTDGTLTSQVSANTTYGFSIVKFTMGSSDVTCGHGLAVEPKFIITKRYGSTGSWITYHASLGKSKYMMLNSTAVAYTDTADAYTSTNSSVFDARAGLIDAGDCISYVWSEIAGFSKFGTFTHTNSSQTLDFGFTPRYWLVKETDGTTPWYIFDAERDNFDDPLFANTNGVSSSGWGFTFSGTTVTWVSGSFLAGTYIYSAFAEKPDQSTIDVLLDSPSQSVADETDTGLGGQITGNYATLNPLSKSSQTNIVLANGNLEASNSSSSGQGRVHGTIAMSSGKWYFEATVTGSSSTHEIGIIKTTEALNYGIGLFAGGYSYIQPGTKFNNNSTPSYGASYTTGDTIGVAFDADNGTLIFYKNGASQGTAFTGLSGTFYPAVSTYSSAANFGWKVNFGQRAFSHAAPSGYKALTVENLSDPTIADGSKYFDTKLWTGDGASTRTISNYGFSPDFIWIKNRTTAGWQHVLYDQIRGAGTGSVTKSLSTDSTRTEASGNDTNHGYLSGFTSDGFNLVKGSQGGGDYVNHNSWDYVGWAWDAGTSTVTNNNGTITSQVRANQTAGFSICTYDGSGSNGTWGHGLLTAPDLVIVKCRNVAQNWAVQHSALGPTNYAYLQTTNAFSTSSGTAFWNNTAPTNTTVSVGTDNDTNSSGKTYVAYSFSTIPGYSSFGKYIGNGDADGIFIYTGFTPSWLLFKRSDSTSDWSIYDTTRDPHNVAGNKLEPNTTDAESSSATVDILSNGFKFRRNSLENGGNDVYVYAAFASKPFNSARAR